jgi:hypothetical protein
MHVVQSKQKLQPRKTKMPDKNESTGMRLEDEGDRPEDFKEARNKLVGSVNDWLLELARKRDAGEPMPDGTVITDKPRITRSIIGRTAVGTSWMAEERKPGIAVIGDGVATAITAQAVVASKDGKGFDMVEVTGSDPLARQFADGEYGDRGGLEKVMSFRQTDITEGSRGEYFGYEVRGDGAMRRQYLRPDGAHSGGPIRTADDVALAADAFQRVQTSFGA